MHKIYCGACGAESYERRALPIAERSPCPACGSTARRVVVEISSAIESDIALPITPLKTRTIGLDAIIVPGIESDEAFGTPAVAAHAEPAVGTGAAYDATVETRTDLSTRVVEEADVVVRVVRHYPPMPDGRRLTTVEDEHGNLRDVGAGASTEDTLLDMIISRALRE